MDSHWGSGSDAERTRVALDGTLSAAEAARITDYRLYPGRVLFLLRARDEITFGATAMVSYDRTGEDTRALLPLLRKGRRAV